MSDQGSNVTPITQLQGTGRRSFQQIVAHSDRLLDQMRELAFKPDQEKKLNRVFTISQAAEMVGRSDDTIRRAEASGDLPKPRLSAAGRRTGYTLEEVNGMRDLFSANPWRARDEEPIRLAFQNFKGGVGKSTLCVHFAQYLSERGYRVLLIDCDSQASTTSTFGVRPDQDIDAEGTLLPFFMNEREDLNYAIQETYWDRLHIIPASLALYTAEYTLAAQQSVGGDLWIERLLAGIETVEHEYDVIIMDPPPALGTISLNVVRALNALIVPVPPAMFDFHSSVTFFRMMEEVLESVESAIDEPVNYKIFKLLISKYDTQKSAQDFMVNLMTDHYAKYMLSTAVSTSAEIDNASADLHTVYELTKPMTSKQTHDRCKSALNGVFREIELHIRRTWPSHQDALREEGLLVL